MQGMQGHQLLLPHMMGQMNPLMHQQQMQMQQQQMLRQQMGLQQGELISTTARFPISQKTPKNQNKKEKSFFVCFSFIFVKLFL